MHIVEVNNFLAYNISYNIYKKYYKIYIIIIKKIMFFHNVINKCPYEVITVLYVKVIIVL